MSSPGADASAADTAVPPDGRGMRTVRRRRLRILTVGDGDLTYSLSLVRALGPSQIDLTASVLVGSEAELIQTYSNAAGVLFELGSEWKVPVLFGVDAARIRETLPPNPSQRHEFDIVAFNHPHLGTRLLGEESERGHALRHHALLAHYFRSAAKVLPNPKEGGGLVHVCLCGTQPSTWDVTGAAVRAGLLLALECGTAGPIVDWLGLAWGGEKGNTNLELLRAKPGYAAPRRYRNGRLGSRHSLGKYGYRHRRTGGEAHGGNDADMAVEGSVNLLFKNCCAKESSKQEGLARDKEGGSNASAQCYICGMDFGPKNYSALRMHLRKPAVPDAVSSLYRDEATGREFSTLYAYKTYESQQEGRRGGRRDIGSRQKRPRTPSLNGDAGRDLVDVSAAPSTVLDKTQVPPEFDGKRLRWLCRQPSTFASLQPLSRRRAEDLIKGGKIHVNGAVALDSGRILRTGDCLRIISSGTFNNGGIKFPEEGIQSSSGNVQIVKVLEYRSALVVFKPVGLRTTGTFSSNTLESIVTSMRNGQQYKVITKLETGCSGLVVMHGSPNLKTEFDITYKFVCLVFGRVPRTWSEGVYVKIPPNICRRWKNHKNTAQNGPDSKCNDDKYVPSTSGESDPSSDELFIQCVARSRHDALSVSTIEIYSSAHDGRLCSISSYILRKLNHGVVNDRFCKREFASMPRAFRNHVKKLCLGCFGLKIIQGDEEPTNVDVPVPGRLNAGYWDCFLSNGADKQNRTETTY